jgi:hypothetical protein
MRGLICLMFALVATGCAAEKTDPFERPGTWSVTGANDANLKVMVADPHDLISGRGETNNMASEASPPVQRLFSGKRFPLSTESASGLGQSTTTQSSTGGGSGAGTQ